MDSTTISAIAVVSAALVTAWFGWSSHRGNTKVSQVNAVMDAYNEIVRNLQAEVARLSNELKMVRDELRDSERRAGEMKVELDILKNEVERSKKPARKPAAVKKTAGRQAKAS